MDYQYHVQINMIYFDQRNAVSQCCTLGSHSNRIAAISGALDRAYSYQPIREHASRI